MSVGKWETLKDKNRSVLLFSPSTLRQAILVNLPFHYQPRAAAAKTADGSGMEHRMSWVPAGYKNLR